MRAVLDKVKSGESGPETSCSCQSLIDKLAISKQSADKEEHLTHRRRRRNIVEILCLHLVSFLHLFPGKRFFTIMQKLIAANNADKDKCGLVTHLIADIVEWKLSCLRSNFLGSWCWETQLYVTIGQQRDQLNLVFEISN